MFAGIIVVASKFGITYNSRNTCQLLPLLIAEWQMPPLDKKYRTKLLLHLRDFAIEVTFFHINAFLKPVVTLSKITSVIDFSAKALRRFPENIFADIVDLTFIVQVTR